MASVSTRRLPCTLMRPIVPESGTGSAASAGVSPAGTEGALPSGAASVVVSGRPAGGGGAFGDGDCGAGGVAG